jgi:glutamate synthase (ferredoxin)
MTGGRVVVLGHTGRNFAAGMSGGIAYVLDESGEFADDCNQESCALQRLEEEEEIAQVRELVERHVAYTDSALARRVLDAWEQMLPQFVKVMPRDYQRMLEATARARAEGLEGEEAVMAAFEANKNAVERVAGG